MLKFKIINLGRNKVTITMDIYPPMGGANALSRWGPLDCLSNLYATGERKLRFQKHQRKSTFFEMPKTFIPRREGRSEPNGVHLTVFPFYWGIDTEN